MNTLNKERTKALEIISNLKNIVDNNTISEQKRHEIRKDMINHQIALLKSYKS